MTTQSKYVALMGVRLGKRFHDLWQELYAVNEKWAEYVTLYWTKPERTKLMNDAARVFFGIAQQAILHDIVLSIARLTERRRDTMTIHTLPKAVKHAFEKEVRKLVSEAQEKSEICEEWRDNWIAHRNAEVALKVRTLPRLPKKYVQEALDAIGAVLSAVHARYTGSGMGFEHPRNPGGSRELLVVLADGVKVGQEREERRQRGTLCPEDLVLRDV